MSYQLKLWDSKREREKINQPEYTAGCSQNKGSEQVQRRARRLRLSQPARGRRQEGGERGRLGPKDGIPYHTANRPPVSNQRLPEILWMVDIRWEGRGKTQGAGTQPAPAGTGAGDAEG